MTHVAFDTVLWNVLKAKINHWRVRELHIVFKPLSD